MSRLQDIERQAIHRDFADRPHPHRAKKLCVSCRKRPATARLLGGETHGWCEVCALEHELAHAHELAATIPALEHRLRRARDAAAL